MNLYSFAFTGYGTAVGEMGNAAQRGTRGPRGWRYEPHVLEGKVRSVPLGTTAAAGYRWFHQAVGVGSKIDPPGGVVGPGGGVRASAAHTRDRPPLRQPVDGGRPMGRQERMM